VTLGGESFFRMFGMIETGEFTSFGTKAFLAASRTKYDKFRGPGEIYKRQVNAGIYQPIGSSGDFIYLKAHYNVNRNNFYRNVTLTDIRNITGRPNMVEVGGLTSAQEDTIFNFENLDVCTRPPTSGGTAQNDGLSSGTAIFGSTNNNPLSPSSCTNFYGLRINPSNTGNVRVNSKFTINDKLTFTMDAIWQYVLANGGGTSTIAESNAIVRGNTALTDVILTATATCWIRCVSTHLTPQIQSVGRY
jgi:iron complex outermembrane recepter protein